MAERIEDLLLWAFRDELPKAGSGEGGDGMGSAWDSILDFGELLTMIDRTNLWGLTIDQSHAADPHPDAVAIGQAVRALADAGFEAPDGYDVLSDVILADGSLPSADERSSAMARALAGTRLSAGRMPGTVMRFAILGGAPEWRRVGSYRRETVMRQKGAAWFRRVERAAGEGRPAISIEVDGYDRKRGRPFPDAYRKSVITPDLAGLAADRLDYQAYVLALATLASDVSERLGRAVDGPILPLWPWEADEGFGFENDEMPENQRSRRSSAA